MIYNSNLYDFFGMDNQSARSLYKELQKVIFVHGMTDGYVPNTIEPAPASLRLMTETAHVVNEIPNNESKAWDVAYGAACVIAIVMFVIMCWLIYDTYIKKPEKKVQPQY
jgi:hypothetical protein